MAPETYINPTVETFARNAEIIGSHSRFVILIPCPGRRRGARIGEINAGLLIPGLLKFLAVSLQKFTSEVPVRGNRRATFGKISFYFEPNVLLISRDIIW